MPQTDDVADVCNLPGKARSDWRDNLTVDSLESTICFYLRGIRGEGKCPCDDRRDDQKYCCLELAETIIADLKE